MHATFRTQHMKVYFHFYNQPTRTIKDADYYAV